MRVLRISKTQRWLNNLGMVVLNSVVLRLLFPTAAVGMALLAQQQGWGLFNYFSVPHAIALVASLLLLDLVIYLQAPVDVLMDRIQRRGIQAEQAIDRRYLESLNEAYSEFFLYYDDAPLLIVNCADIDISSDDDDYLTLVDYLLNVRSGRHYFNPTIFS